MSFISENLQILAILGSTLTLYFFIRKGASKESVEIKNELKEIRQELKSIDQRLFKLEGAFEERGRWEARDWEPKIKKKKD